MLFLTQKAELFKSKFWQMKHPNICSNLILPYINNTFKKIMKKKKVNKYLEKTRKTEKATC